MSEELSTAVRQAREKLEEAKNRLAGERDALRDLIGDFEDLACEADVAIDDLEHAIMSLSQWV